MEDEEEQAPTVTDKEEQAPTVEEEQPTSTNTHHNPPLYWIRKRETNTNLDNILNIWNKTFFFKSLEFPSILFILKFELFSNKIKLCEFERLEKIIFNWKIKI